MTVISGSVVNGAVAGSQTDETSGSHLQHVGGGSAGSGGGPDASGGDDNGQDGSGHGPSNTCMVCGMFCSNVHSLAAGKRMCTRCFLGQAQQLPYARLPLQRPQVLGPRHLWNASCAVMGHVSAVAAGAAHAKGEGPMPATGLDFTPDGVGITRHATATGGVQFCLRVRGASNNARQVRWLVQ